MYVCMHVCIFPGCDCLLILIFEHCAQITLQSAKESLYSLMREVELKENSVEQAEEEAAHGGLSILINVKELKQMLQRAKEANDMVLYLYINVFG